MNDVAPGQSPSRSGPRDAAVRVNDEWCENGAAGQPRCGICAGCKLKIRRYVAELKAMRNRSAMAQPEATPNMEGE